MKIIVIAAVCESVYYNGRIKTGSRKLDIDDFEQLAIAAHGSIMRKLYYDLKKAGGEALYFSDSIDYKTFKVKTRGKDKYFEIEEQLVNMPYGMSIFGIFPVNEKGVRTDKDIRFLKAQYGQDWLYDGEDFDDVPFYIKKGKRVWLYNCDFLKQDEEVEVEGLFNEDDIDIPNDVAFEVINTILGTTLKVAGFPIDPTNDNNPNSLEIRKKLADPASV
jgi:hypothetical protein